MTQPSEQNDTPWAIALVHGIGTTEPLRMIQEVSDALRQANPAIELESDAEVHDVEENGTVRHNVIRHGVIKGPASEANVRIGTAHWADITFYRRGLVNMVGALMMTAFGVRFFAQVATRTVAEANWFVRSLARCLRFVLQFMVHFLAVVIFPLTLVSLIFSCMGLLGVYVLKFNAKGIQKESIALAGIALCLATAYIGMKRTRSIRNERPLSPWIFMSIGLIGTVIGVLMLLGNYIWTPVGLDKIAQGIWHVPQKGVPLPPDGFLPLSSRLRDALVELAKLFEYPTLADRIGIVDNTAVWFALLHCLQIGAGMLMLSLTLVTVTLLALLRIITWLTGTRISTFVFATVSVISIWIINLILLWPENLATFAAMAEFLDDDKLKSTIRISTIDWATWTLKELPLNLASPVADRPGFLKNRLYSETYPLLWFEAAFLIFLALTLVLVIGVFTARRLWCARYANGDVNRFATPPGMVKPRFSNWPRVIISKGYVILVMILIVVVPYVFLALVLFDRNMAVQSWLINWLGQLPHEISVGAEWARMGVILFLGLFIFFSHYISAGSKLVLDVVNHFTAPHLGFPVRQRIERRFEEMVETLLSANDTPNLVIMAHSQGTIITLDALRRSEWIDKTLSRVKTLTVITFGSPITHVYQEYFPEPYPDLAATSLAKLHADDKEGRVKWFNVFRVDDFVGTYIEASIENFPINVPTTGGGHTNYWQKDVFAALFARPEMKGILMASSNIRAAVVSAPIDVSDTALAAGVIA